MSNAFFSLSLVEELLSLRRVDDHTYIKLAILVAKKKLVRRIMQFVDFSGVKPLLSSTEAPTLFSDLLQDL